MFDNTSYFDAVTGYFDAVTGGRVKKKIIFNSTNNVDPFDFDVISITYDQSSGATVESKVIDKTAAKVILRYLKNHSDDQINQALDYLDVPKEDMNIKERITYYYLLGE